MATILITGANGFIGNELLRYFYSRGHKIIALSRSKPPDLPEKAEYYKYNLSEPIDEEIFRNVDVIIHAAYQKYTRKCMNSDEINLNGTKQLLALSRKHNIKKFIYFSSFSAHPEALSHYGKSKREIEKIFDISHDLILKPGLVLGNRGLFANLFEIILNHKIIPVIAGGKQPVQTILITDLIRCVENAMIYDINGIFPLAEINQLPLKEVIKIISKITSKKNIIISVPYAVAFSFASTFNMLRIKIPLSLENIQSLKSDISYDTSNVKDIFKIEIRPFHESIRMIIQSRPG